MTAAILALATTFASLPSFSNQLPGVIRIGAILTGWYLRNMGQTLRVGMELNEQCTTPRYGEEHLSKGVCQRTKPSNNHRGQYRYTLPHYVNGPTTVIGASLATIPLRLTNGTGAGGDNNGDLGHVPSWSLLGVKALAIPPSNLLSSICQR